MIDQNSPNHVATPETNNRENNQLLGHLMTVGSLSKEELRIKQKFERLLKSLIMLEALIVSYLALFGAIGITSRINLQVAPLPPFAIISFFVFFILVNTYSIFSIIRKGNIDIILLVLIGSASILGFSNPFIQALNFYLTYILNDVGKLTRYFLQAKENYSSYLETVEVERMYLSFQRLLVSLTKKNVLIFVLGMMPLVLSVIIEIDIGYRTTLLYPFLIFIALIMLFLTKMGLSKSIVEQLFNPRTRS